MTPADSRDQRARPRDRATASETFTKGESQTSAQRPAASLGKPLRLSAMGLLSALSSAGLYFPVFREQLVLCVIYFGLHKQCEGPTGQLAPREAGWGARWGPPRGWYGKGGCPWAWGPGGCNLTPRPGTWVQPGVERVGVLHRGEGQGPLGSREVVSALHHASDPGGDRAARRGTRGSRLGQERQGLGRKPFRTTSSPPRPLQVPQRPAAPGTTEGHVRTSEAHRLVCCGDSARPPG